MASQLTPLGRALVMASGLSIVAFTVHTYGLLDKLIPSARLRATVVPAKVDLPDVPGAASAFNGAVVAIADPGTGAGCTDKPEVRTLIWAWNAQMGMMYATGGPQATQGSLMCGHGVNLRLMRQDDVSRMQADLVAFASELKHGNPQPTQGAHFVSIMGDGSATFLAGVNDTLEKLGPEYRAKVIASAGYSRGEDKFMGPPTWKQTPARSAGGLVAGVLRDGDWNIAQKWLGDNGLCNNPDESTWDAACLNWVNASTYLDASEKYVAGYCETRPVVSKGRKTGESRKVCVDAVVTWTPGDVIVAEKKGGLVSIVSTREYSAQMPNVLIGIDKWMTDNRATVQGMLAAVFEGGDQVKANERAFRKAAEVSAAVYAEQGASAEYWAKYFRVVKQPDRTGLMVELGGSSVNNLADNLMLFGLVPGAANVFAATYGVFGNLVVAQYPDLVPRIDPVSRVLDTSFLQAVAQTSAATTQADLPRFERAQAVRTVVSRRAWQIAFDSGQASFSPAAQAQLQQLLADLLVASSTAVEVHGHTDGQGSADANMALSEARAFAVKQWLEAQSPVNFPQARVRVFAHGQQNPVAPNATADGRAQNRRVEIVLGTAAD